MTNGTHLVWAATHSVAPIRSMDIERDLSPLSPSECARRGIKHSNEDHATNEFIEFPALPFRRQLLRVAAERTKL